MAQTAMETTATAQIAEAKTWLQKHERLLIVVLVVGLFAYGIHSVLNLEAHNADVKVQQATAQLNDQKAANAQLASQVQATTQQYQQMVNTLSAQNAQLAATIAERDKTLATQQATDQTLPLPELAGRWAMLAHFDENELQTDGTTLKVPQDVVQKTTTQLESVPVLQANLKDTQTQLDNTKGELASADTLIGQQKQQVSGLQLQITDGQKTCKDQITAIKAQARKSKLKWFGWGFVTGFVSGHIW